MPTIRLNIYFFAGPEEIYELYRCAYQETKKWIMELASIDPFGTNGKINRELKKVWFCALTDSLRINSFLHVVGSKGKRYRPDWLSLSEFGNGQKIRTYIRNEKIEYLVLLEDFVGSGKQAARIVQICLGNSKYTYSRSSSNNL